MLHTSHTYEDGAQHRMETFPGRFRPAPRTLETVAPCEFGSEALLVLPVALEWEIRSESQFFCVLHGWGAVWWPLSSLSTVFSWWHLGNTPKNMT